MPQPFKRAILTNGGLALLNRAQAGETMIRFTKAVIGDGKYNTADKSVEALQEMEALKSQKNSYAISSVEKHGDHAVKLTALITNEDPESHSAIVEEGYYINEIGVFAKPSDDGEGVSEVLFCIAVTDGENGDFMPAYNGVNPAQIVQSFFITVSNSAKVTIETAGAFALAEDLEKLRKRVDELGQEHQSFATKENVCIFSEKIVKDVFRRFYDMVDQETEFFPDGHIVTENDEATVITTFALAPDGVETITDRLVRKGKGGQTYIKTTTITPASASKNKKIKEVYSIELELEFRIQDQHIERIDDYCVIAGGQDYLKAKFEFDTDWQSAAKTAVFQCGDEDVDHSVVLEGNECMIPGEVIRSPFFYVSVSGSGAETHLATDRATVPVREPGYCTGSPSNPSAYEQLLEKLDRKGDSLSLEEENLILKSGEKELSRVVLEELGVHEMTEAEVNDLINSIGGL